MLQHWHNLVKIHAYRSYLLAKESTDIHFTARGEIFIKIWTTKHRSGISFVILYVILYFFLEHWHNLVQKYVYRPYLVTKASIDIHFTARGEVFIELWRINHRKISHEMLMGVGTNIIISTKSSSFKPHETAMDVSCF